MKSGRIGMLEDMEELKREQEMEKQKELKKKRALSDKTDSSKFKKTKS